MALSDPDSDDAFARYQQEVADLRQQLWRLQNGAGDSGPTTPTSARDPGASGSRSRIPLSPRSVAESDRSSLAEILELRERLEEEKAAREALECDKVKYEAVRDFATFTFKVFGWRR
eukprot:scaffold207362_cov38-Prasinocladus_malaysianus.AAC.1